MKPSRLWSLHVDPSIVGKGGEHSLRQTQADKEVNSLLDSSPTPLQE